MKLRKIMKFILGVILVAVVAIGIAIMNHRKVVVSPDIGTGANTEIVEKDTALEPEKPIKHFESIITELDSVLEEELETEPPAPSNLISTLNCAKDSLSLSWQDNSSNEECFEIWLAYSPDFIWENWDTTSPSATSFIALSPNEDITYMFKVRAYNSSGYSAFSNTTQIYKVNCEAGTSSALNGIEFCQQSYPNDPNGALSCLVIMYGGTPKLEFEQTPALIDEFSSSSPAQEFQSQWHNLQNCMATGGRWFLNRCYYY